MKPSFKLFCSSLGLIDSSILGTAQELTGLRARSGRKGANPTAFSSGPESIMASGGYFEGIDSSKAKQQVQMRALMPLTTEDSKVFWYQLGQDLEGEAEDDEAGFSVSLSADGKTAAVGSPKFGNGNRGKVDIYRLNEVSSWVKIGDDLRGERNGDSAGWSVSISDDGDTVAIGSSQSEENGIKSGQVQVFRLDAGGDWVQIGQDLEGGSARVFAGWAVSISGNGKTVAYGLPGWGNGDRGRVRVFRFNGTKNRWLLLGQNLDGEHSHAEAGYSVSLSEDGNTVAVGSGNFNTGSGQVEVYRLDDSGTNWVALGQDLEGEKGEKAGYSVSLSGNGESVAVGSPYAKNNARGRAEVFRLDDSGTTWNRIGSNSDLSPDAQAEDRAGYSVSLSENGNTVAVGAKKNDDNGDNAGQVQIYRLDAAGAWAQIGQNLVGVEEQDRAGASVSLSEDGNTVAVGSNRNDGNGDKAGHVRIFKSLTFSCNYIERSIFDDKDLLILKPIDVFYGPQELVADGSITLALSKSNFTYADDVGTTTSVTLTVTDKVGNEATCESLVAIDGDGDPQNEAITGAVLIKNNFLIITEGKRQLMVDLNPLVDDADSDPGNELIQTAVFDDKTNEIKIAEAGKTFTMDLNPLVNDADSDPENELIQTAVFDDTTKKIKITDAGKTFTMDLSSLVDDADSDPENELIQTAVFDDKTNEIKITDAGKTFTMDLNPLVNDADSDPENELIQTAVFDDTTKKIKITDAGKTFTMDLSSLVDDADSDPGKELIQTAVFDPMTKVIKITDAGKTFTMDLSPLVKDADSDPQNELIQTAVFDPATKVIKIIDAGKTFTMDLNPLVKDADSDPQNELIQTAIFDDKTNEIKITDAGKTFTMDLNPLVKDADSDPQNELIQTAVFDDTTKVIKITDAGKTFTMDLNPLVDDADSDPENELIQTAVFDDTTKEIRITDAGKTFTMDLSSLRISNLQATVVKSSKKGTKRARGLKASQDDDDFVVFYGYGATNGFAMVRAGRLLGMSIVPNEPFTAGKLTVEVTVDGIRAGGSIVLDVTETSEAIEFDEPIVVNSKAIVAFLVTVEGPVEPKSSDGASLVLLLEQ